MDPHIVKYIVLGVIFTGALVVAPVIMALLSHQQKMAKIFADSQRESSELASRVASLERTLNDLAPAQRPVEAEERLRHLS